MIPNKTYYIRCFLFVFLTIPFLSKGQAPESHSKTTFTDSLKNLYIHQDLPLNLLAIIGGNNAGSQAIPNLKSDDGGVKFDKPGRYYLDLYPVLSGKSQTKGRFFIGVDGTSPTTKYSLSNAPIFKTDSLTYYGKGLKLSAKATDDLSGLKGTYYQLNGQPFEQYSDSIGLNTDGIQTFSTYSADKVGNTEELKTATFFVDTQAPSTKSSTMGISVEDILSSTTKIALDATDQGVGVRTIFYSFNSAKKSIYSKPLSISSMADGEHILSFYSVDKVNNAEDKNEFKYYLDKLPPYVAYKVIGKKFLGNQLYAAPGAKIRFDAVDNHSGVDSIFYTIGGKEYTYSGMFELNKLSGSHQISYYATDKVGNTSKTNKENISIFFDDEPPVLTPQFLGKKFESRDTTFIKNLTQIELNVSDKASGVKQSTFQINDRSLSTYENPFKVVEDGYHQVFFTSTDQVGNSSSDTLSFFVDNEPPEIIIDFSTPVVNRESDGHTIHVMPPHALIYLSAIDSKTGVDEIYYKVGNSVEKKYESALKNFKKGKVIAITIMATDVLGNAKSENIYILIEG